MGNDGPYEIEKSEITDEWFVIGPDRKLWDIYKSESYAEMGAKKLNKAWREGRASRDGLLVALVSWMKYADEKKYGIRDSIHLKNLFNHAVGMTEKVLKEDAQ